MSTDRSADFQSAVSQISNLPPPRALQTGENIEHSADSNSATQQIGNLRYAFNNKFRWLTVVIYATAMAWVESAVVFYLRTMVDRIGPYQPNPLPIIGKFGIAEIVREAATMV